MACWNEGIVKLESSLVDPPNEAKQDLDCVTATILSYERKREFLTIETSCCKRISFEFPRIKMFGLVLLWFWNRLDILLSRD